MEYASLPSDIWCWPDFADLTPEDKFYLFYLHTNPHVTITGCYALPRRIAAAESGYNEETSDRILARLVDAGNWIQIDPTTREVLLIRWPEINPGWFAKNSNTYKGLVKGTSKIKSDKLRAVVQSWLIVDTPSKGLPSPLEAPSMPPVSITHHYTSPHYTSPHRTSPSSYPDHDDDGDDPQHPDLTPLLQDVPPAERGKLSPRIHACLAAGHPIHVVQRTIDAARREASSGRSWIGLGHHKLAELARTPPPPPAPPPKTTASTADARPDPTPVGRAAFEAIYQMEE